MNSVTTEKFPSMEKKNSVASTLKGKAVSGIVWTAIQRYSTIFIQFVSSIILARLLTPYDYGCIGMLTIFMMLAQTFIDSGFGSALIQKKKPTQTDYSSIFWWNMGVAFFMYGLLFLFAPTIAQFYKIPLLSQILRVQGIILPIYAFNIIQQNQLRKTFHFKTLASVAIVTSLVALGVTIWMAYSGLGPWALVTQNILTAAIPAFIFWFAVKWRPSFVFSWRSFRELFGFGFYMFMTNLINEFSNQVQGLLIGRIYNANTLGYYSKARQSERLAATSISQIIVQVTYPLYVEVQDNKEMLAGMIKRITTTLAYISFPLMFILMLCAKPIFLILFSERWLQSVPYFQILCVSGLALCLQSVNTHSIAAIGKSKVMFRWAFIKRGVGLSIIIGGMALGGLTGLLLADAIVSWFVYFVNIGLVSKYIGYKWWIQLKHLSPVMIIAVAALAIGYSLSRSLSLPLYYDAIVRLIAYLITYVGLSVLFKLDAFDYFKDLAFSLIRKFRK